MTPEKTTLDRIYLSDYQPPGFLITTTVLHFELSANNTRVRSQLSIRRRNSNQGSLRLDGEALELESIRVDGKELTPNQYTIDDHSLTVHDVPSQFTLQIENYISPAANTKLEGLYPVVISAPSVSRRGSDGSPILSTGLMCSLNIP